MTILNEQTTVGDWVRDNPARSRIFEKLKIDYCCGGKHALVEVCAKHGLDVAVVLGQLRQIGGKDPSFVDADAMPLDELIGHIVSAHHDYLREELPRLEFMTRKVAAVHGEDEPRLLEIRATFVPFAEEMILHTEKEERVLFPMIGELATVATTTKKNRGSIAGPIEQMELEHDSAGQALERLRELSDDYTPPDWACNTFRALYDTLDRLERNMHQHVHKENNVLFPKALKIEQNLVSSGSC